MIATKRLSDEATKGKTAAAPLPLSLRRFVASSLPRPAFTLVEMLTTVALLVIVLGLMVSLARDVRNRSADTLTKQILQRMDMLVAQYRAKLPEGDRSKYPIIHPFIGAGEAIDERTLRERAIQNNKELVRTLKQHLDRQATAALNEFSIANYTEVLVLDAWGSPVVYMPGQHPAVGAAAKDRSFFFCAGPDRRYLTKHDNLYSYETGGGEEIEDGKPGDREAPTTVSHGKITL